MAKTYRVTPFIRFVNRMMARMIRWNIAPPHTYLLTVRGRKTGKPYSTPVMLVEEDDQRWLVAPYGEVGWLKNARAVGEVTLFRHGKTETVRIQPVGAEASALVLKRYITLEGIVRPYFDVQPDSPIEAFVAEAPRHPVFLLEAI